MKLTARDLWSDCRTMFNRSPCLIISTLGSALITVLVWYANRIETKTEEMQESLNQIEFNVGILIDRQPSRPPLASPNGIASAEAPE